MERASHMQPVRWAASACVEWAQQVNWRERLLTIHFQCFWWSWWWFGSRRPLREQSTRCASFRLLRIGNKWMVWRANGVEWEPGNLPICFVGLGAATTTNCCLNGVLAVLLRYPSAGICFKAWLLVIVSVCRSELIIIILIFFSSTRNIMIILLTWRKLTIYLAINIFERFVLYLASIVRLCESYPGHVTPAFVTWCMFIGRPVVM